MDVSGDPSTTMVEFPLSEPRVAVIVAFPAASAVTLPPVALATFGADDVQVTMLPIT